MAEYAARDHLEIAGIEVFLPCARAHPSRPGHQDAPLFPGYLFLNYDLEEQGWARLHRIPQLLGLVAFGGEVPPVPDEVIDELAQRVRAINGTGGLWTRFRSGDRVRVALGPTESLAEVIEETKSPQSRVRVLMEFLGRLVEARVRWQDVQPVAANGLVHNHNGHPQRRTRGRGRWIRGFGPRIVEAL